MTNEEIYGYFHVRIEAVEGAQKDGDSEWVRVVDKAVTILREQYDLPAKSKELHDRTGKSHYSILPMFIRKDMPQLFKEGYVPGTIEEIATKLSEAGVRGKIEYAIEQDENGGLKVGMVDIAARDAKGARA